MRRRLLEFVLRLRESAAEAPFGRPTNCVFDRTPTGSKTYGEFQMTKLNQPKILTPDTFFNYLLIIDIEVTYEDRNLSQSDNFTHEAIAFPVHLNDTRQRSHSLQRQEGISKPIGRQLCKREKG